MWNLLIAVGVMALMYVAGRWLYQKDQEMEKRRRAAFRISSQLRSQGLTVVPDFLEDYAVGDYSTMAHKLQEAAVVLFNDSALNAEFENVWQTLLQGKLNDPAELQKLFDMVKSKVQADPVLNQAVAPATAAAAPAASDATFTAQHVADIVSQAVQSAVAAVKAVGPAVQAVEQVAATAAKVA